jgi:hypothetical protein
VEGGCRRCRGVFNYGCIEEDNGLMQGKGKATPSAFENSPAPSALSR